MAREGKAARRNAVFVVVILGHALLIVFFLRPDVPTKDQLKKKRLITAAIRPIDPNASAQRRSASGGGYTGT